MTNPVPAVKPFSASHPSGGKPGFSAPHREHVHGDRDAVHVEGVAIGPGVDRAERHFPDSLFALLHLGALAISGNVASVEPHGFGLIAGNETGIQGVLVYVLVYTFMNLGAFLVVVALRRKGILGEDIEAAA